MVDVAMIIMPEHNNWVMVLFFRSHGLTGNRLMSHGAPPFHALSGSTTTTAHNIHLIDPHRRRDEYHNPCEKMANDIWVVGRLQGRAKSAQP